MNQMNYIKETSYSEAEKDQMRRRLRKLQWPMYIIAILCYMLTMFHRMTPSIMGPDLVADLKLTAVAFGFMGLAFTWVYALAQAPVGTIMDKIGARKGLTAILILGTIGGIFFGLAQSFTFLVIGRVLLALSVSGFLIGGAKITSAWFTTAQYPILWGLFMGLGSLGSVLGTAPLSALMDGVGWRSAMIGVAIFSLVLAIVAYTVLRDSPAEKGLLTPDELAGVMQEPKAVEESTEQAGIGLVLRSPLLWLVFLLSLGANSHAQCFGGLWEGVYLSNVFGFDNATIGNILIWYAWGIVAGCFLSGPTVRALGSRRTMFYGVIIIALNWIWLMTHPDSLSIVQLCVFNFLLGGLQMFVISTTFIFCQETFPQSHLGTAIGFLNTFVWVVAAGIGQQVWGVIIDAVSKGVQPYPISAFTAAMWFNLALSIIAIICAWVLFSSKKYSSAS